MDQQSFDDLRAEFTRAQTQFAVVITELEAELKRMHGNEKISYEITAKKDLQIESLIKFNNKVDDIMRAYQFAMINNKASIEWHQQAYLNAAHENDDLFSFLRSRMKLSKGGSAQGETAG